MKVSVITPTAERASFLKAAHRLLERQSYSNWEWLIYDTSLQPTSFSDKRIIYTHDLAIVSIGEKRNRLIDQASGEIIVHFDDDDYYMPTYLEKIVETLQTSAFFSRHSWFSYDLKTRQIFYWDPRNAGEVRYHLHGMMGRAIREILVKEEEQESTSSSQVSHNGYGFSFAYRKVVTQQCRFPDLDFGEDVQFIEAVKEAGFVVTATAACVGEVIHVFHDTNTSGEFPQYRIPQFLVEPVFPDFFSHLRGLVHPGS